MEKEKTDTELLQLVFGVQVEIDNLRAFSLKSLPELQKIKGIGATKAEKIQAVFEIARRFSRVELKPGQVLSRSQQVFAHYHYNLRDEKREKFYAVLLDTKNRVIREELVSIGTLNFSLVHPREIFAPAIKESAASVILVHNHPSGDPAPSREDIQITTRLSEVGRIVGIEIIDHIIIGDGCYISFNEQKLM